MQRPQFFSFNLSFTQVFICCELLAVSQNPDKDGSVHFVCFCFMFCGRMDIGNHLQCYIPDITLSKLCLKHSFLKISFSGESGLGSQHRQQGFPLSALLFYEHKHIGINIQIWILRILYIKSRSHQILIKQITVMVFNAHCICLFS